jgi:hypothetical protein
MSYDRSVKQSIFMMSPCEHLWEAVRNIATRPAYTSLATYKFQTSQRRSRSGATWTLTSG